MNRVMDIEVPGLAGIFKLVSKLMPVGVAVLTDEGVLSFELFGRLLADPVGLARVSFDTDVGVEGPALVYKFEEVAMGVVCVHISINLMNIVEWMVVYCGGCCGGVRMKC
jgi:hypothetical protein